MSGPKIQIAPDVLAWLRDPASREWGEIVPASFEAPITHEGREVARAVVRPVIDPGTGEARLELKVQF